MFIAILACLVAAPVAGGGDSSLPPPPPWFSPAAVRYVGDRYGNPRAEDGVIYLGGVDGSGLSTIRVPGAGAVQFAANGLLLAQVDRPTRQAPGRRSMVVIAPDGTVTVLVPALFDRWTLDIDGDTAYAISGDRSPGRTVWRVPTAGGPMRRTGLVHPRASTVAVSPDGRSIAAGWDGEPYGPVRAIFDGAPQRRSPKAVPLGFDARGRLIRLRGDVQALDPRSGKIQRVVGARAYDGDGYVTRDGAAFVCASGSDGILVVDLIDGDRRRLDLAPAGDGAWTLYRTSDDRYVVAIRTDRDLLPDLVAIHDRWEGWTGYLPWRGGD